MHSFGTLVALLLLISSSAQGADRKPNILWLIGENLSHDLGCYGETRVRTPCLDRLAAEGTRYTHVFATNPACSPSRSAFFTGMYQTTTDTHAMRMHRTDTFRLPPGVRPITHRLRELGYFTANIETIGTDTVGTGKLDLNFVNEGPIYHEHSKTWESLAGKRPFFAVVNSLESEYDIYDRKSASKDRVPWVGEREHVRHADPKDVTPPPYYPDHAIVREEWARYLNSVSGMDARFGKVLDQLRADGLEDDTIIMFFGDNGRLEPRGIHWCYDSGLRVPLIIRWPKNFPAPAQLKPGRVDDHILSLIDVTATTLILAGGEKPPLMQGRVFLGQRAEAPRTAAFSARDRIDETKQRIRSAREARYHYIRTYSQELTFASLNRYKEKCFPIMPLMREMRARNELRGPPLDLMLRTGPCEELYDTLADPHEVVNLIESPEREHQDALIRLRSALDTWVKETGDRGARPEENYDPRQVEKEMHDWFGTPAWHQSPPSASK